MKTISETSDRPSVLIVATCSWAHTARLALEFVGEGYAVACLSPAGHPMRSIARIETKLRHSLTRPLAALRHAILRARPDFIIPGDDRAVRQLHRLHARVSRPGAQAPALKALIERSLGAPDGYDVVRSRERMQSLAARLGIRVPDCAAVRSHADLVAWHDSVPLPWVLKTDGSSGGTGVRVVTSLAEAQRAFDQMIRPPSPLLSAKLALDGADPFALTECLDRSAPTVSIQRFIAGKPANCAVACWQGQPLDGIAAEVLVEHHENGPSIAVRIVEGAEMLDAARKLTAALGMTGIVGFDFIIEQATSRPYLLEVNPRGTPICHLQLGKGRDLVGALSARIAAVAPRELPPVTGQDLVGYFPELHLRDPGHPVLRDGYHDVPLQEPALMRALLDPWSRPANHILRSAQQMLGRLRRRRRRKSAGGSPREADVMARAGTDDWAPPPLTPGVP
jgi:hypothetical protein